MVNGTRQILSKCRGGRTGWESKGERTEVEELRRRGVRRRAKMEVEPWLQLEANNPSHNHTTHLTKYVCVWVRMKCIIHNQFINYSLCCIIRRVWNHFFVLSTQCVGVCLQLSRVPPILVSYLLLRVWKWIFTLKKKEPWEMTAQGKWSTHWKIYNTASIGLCRVRIPFECIRTGCIVCSWLTNRGF